jgi:PAS domain-containing protein
LLESDERFQILANSIPHLAWMAQADGYTVWYNRRWYEYTGTTPQQMAGWGWQSVHDPVVLPTVDYSKFIDAAKQMSLYWLILNELPPL